MGIGGRWRVGRGGVVMDGKKGDSRFLRLDLHWSSLVRQWTDEACPIHQLTTQLQRSKRERHTDPHIL